MPSLINLILTFLLVAMPTGGRFGSIALDEDHEKDRTEETTTHEVAGEHRELRPHGAPSQVSEVAPAPRASHPGFAPTSNLRAAELSLRGAAERRML